MNLLKLEQETSSYVHVVRIYSYSTDFVKHTLGTAIGK